MPDQDGRLLPYQQPVAFEKLEYHWPDRYYVGRTGERQEMRLVTVPEYAWTCEKCPARGVDYEDESTALDAAVRHQSAAHSAARPSPPTAHNASEVPDA